LFCALTPPAKAELDTRAADAASTMIDFLMILILRFAAAPHSSRYQDRSSLERFAAPSHAQIFLVLSFRNSHPKKDMVLTKFFGVCPCFRQNDVIQPIRIPCGIHPVYMSA